MFNRFSKTVLSLLLVVCLVVSVSVPACAGSGEKYTYEVTYHQTEARTLLGLVNKFRTGSGAWYWNSDNSSKTVCSGLSKLVYDYDLEKIAMTRAAETVANFAHTRPNGDKWTTLYPSGYVYIEENLGCGHGTAAILEESLEETDKDYSGQGHRRNMLSNKVTAMGAACVEYNGIRYWVEEFRNPAGSTKATAANDSKTKVTVQIDDSCISSKTLNASQTVYSLNTGDKVKVPAITLDTTLSTYWHNVFSTTADNVTWTSDNSSVAYVEEGYIYATGAGKAELTAKSSGFAVYISVRVTDPVPPHTVPETSPTMPYNPPETTTEPTTVPVETTSPPVTEQCTTDNTATEPASDNIDVTGPVDYVLIFRMILYFLQIAFSILINFASVISLYLM